MKKLLLTTILTVTTLAAHAEEIALECNYTTPNGKNFVNRILIDPANSSASVSENGRSYAATLYADQDSYWFTAGEVLSAMDLRAKHTISRKDLSYTASMLLNGRTMTGQCARVEVKNKI